MRHVDDGTIHAWLDGQLDPAAAAVFDTHVGACPGCAARVAAERATLEQAEALLAGATSAAVPPPFSQVEARASAPSAGAAIEPGGRRWLPGAAWAATILFALGIGWFARDLRDRSQPVATLSRVESDAAQPASATPPSSSVRQETEIAPDGPPAIPRTAVSAPAGPAAAPLPAATTREASPPTAADTVTVTGETPVVDVEGTSRAPREERGMSEADTNRGAAANREAVAQGTARRLPPARPTGTPPASPTTARVSARPEAVSAPMAAGAAAGERLSAASGETVFVPMFDPAWDIVPRTQAAVRTGMALYGIRGAKPIATSVSPDGRAVRTTYLLESGARVELEQRRVQGELGNAGGTEGRAGAPGVLGITAEATAPSTTWSATRGGARLTLRTLSSGLDLDALGERLQVE